MIFKSRPIVLPADRFQRQRLDGRPRRLDNADADEPFVWKRGWVVRLARRKWLLTGLVAVGFGVAVISVMHIRDSATEARAALGRAATANEQR